MSPDLGSPSVPRIGTDAEGRVHYYNPSHDRVLVAEGRDVVDVQDLGGRTPTEWVQFVAERTGWQSLGIFEHLAEQYHGGVARKRGHTGEGADLRAARHREATISGTPSGRL